MQRVDAQEILDSGGCSVRDAQGALAVLGRINRWFGGVATTQKMVERIAQATSVRHFSLLEVAAGLGEVPAQVSAEVARRGITLDVTLLDRARSHLPNHHLVANRNRANGNHFPRNGGVVADALALPFGDGAFDLVSCSLFAHHLNTCALAEFVREGLRVSRRALLINDLVRHPVHLALVYASFPIMRSRVAWLDGLTSVRRAYVPDEIRSVLASAFSSELQVELSCHYLYRMGIIVWKRGAAANDADFFLESDRKRELAGSEGLAYNGG
jgi:SAM-dependent methyltransferase